MGKNEETAGVLRTILGGQNTPPFRVLASPLFSSRRRHRERHPLHYAIYGFTFDFNFFLFALRMGRASERVSTAMLYPQIPKLR